MNNLDRARLGVSAAVTAALLASCSTTSPAPAPTPASTSTPPRSVSWLCAAIPRTVALQAAGVPADSRPVDMALSPETISVLLNPARIVTFSRTDPKGVDMIVGGKDNPWSSIDRDPTDGSLWLASDETVSLLRIAQTGERSVVAGPPVEGQGGFRQIRITRDAIYALPTGSSHAVWRLSRDGKLLGQAFGRDTRDDATGVYTARRGFWLAHDLAGNVVAFDRGTGEASRARADGTWEPLPGRFPPRPKSEDRSLRGENVGTSSETWYFTDDIQGFFFLPGGPALLGSDAAGVRSRGSVLFQMHDGKVETATETCVGSPLIAVVSDSRGFAAVSSSSMRTSTTGQTKHLSGQVLLGEFPQ